MFPSYSALEKSAYHLIVAISVELPIYSQTSLKKNEKMILKTLFKKAILCFIGRMAHICCWFEDTFRILNRMLFSLRGPELSKQPLYGLPIKGLLLYF